MKNETPDSYLQRNDYENEPGPPDPDEFCPVCWKHERECRCPYDDCEPLQEAKGRTYRADDCALLHSAQKRLNDATAPSERQVRVWKSLHLRYLLLICRYAAIQFT